MSEKQCNEIEVLLVDYVDGELGPDDRAKVEAHVDLCNRCREMITDLERSLDRVRGVWQENLAGVDGAGGQVAVKGGARKLWLGAVGSIAAAVLVLFCLNLGSGNGLENDQMEELVPIDQLMAQIDQLMAQIDYEIEMAGSAARLLASAEKLAEEDGLRETAVKQYRFIAEAYAGTAAAKRARLLIE